ncbi:cytoskeleton-associated protein 2 [Echeneis naucrates]|uniref:Cytoskeleton-associated protein 2-like n=1 Tax=Echeneis naucrates TaxID=173247 RepID=A0A665W512_ECHNA|nr:cytoskeleton-associated protein 2-like [Echeneis naucrates]
MDATVSRRNHIKKKGNKENTHPADRSKPFIKRDKACAAPFHLKGNEKEEKLAKSCPLKAKAKDPHTKSSSDGGTLVRTVLKYGRGATTASNVTQQQTYSQAFQTEQALKHKKMVADAPKPPTAVPTSKHALGMYKGKVIQSKIGSIWKSSASLDQEGCKLSAPKATKPKSISVADPPRPPTRSKAVGPKPAVRSRPPFGSYSARPAPSAGSRNTTVAPTRASVTQNSKPKVSVTDKKVNKLSVSSTLSQYRTTMETAEERRAKLAAWQISKGKTFKRPAMTTLPQKNKVSKAEADLKSQFRMDLQPATQCKSESSGEAHKPDSAAVPSNCVDTQVAEIATCDQTPAIMNTTLDLLDNSDSLLPVVPQDRIDDVVVNLCDALEAMSTPSRCNDELSQVSNECGVEMKDEQETECTKEVENEILQDVCEQLKVEQVKDEREESEDKVETDDDDDDDDDDEEEVKSDDVMETTPTMRDASVVKYSVRTTPYLQSVKKTIQGETSASQRKSNIKDLKFLTPVRRSCRIQRKSSHLPAMLIDHDPCVSSLAELVKLDDDPNAYIYRKNPALLDDLPDHSSL